MSYVKNSSKKVIVSAIMTLLVALAMMPGMAFANSTLAINPVGSVFVGDAPTLSVAPAPNNIDSHIDWTSSNTAVATISTHNGKVMAITPGTTTITATLMSGEKPTGTGGGTGGSCATDVLGTATINITVLATEEYGFQGISGNQLKMLTPSDITAGVLTDGQFLNKITTPLIANQEGYYAFQFTMSAGMNNFNENYFIVNNMPLIKVTQNGQDKATFDEGTVIYDSCQNKNITVLVDATALDASGEYVLEFGSGIRGNNESKTLGVPVKFAFNI